MWLHSKVKRSFILNSFYIKWHIPRLFVIILMIMAYSWLNKIHCLKMLEYSKKLWRVCIKDVVKSNALSTWSSCRNYCTSVVQSVRCHGGPGCFDGGLQLIYTVGSGVSSSSQYPIDSPHGSHQRSFWPVKHSDTIVSKPATSRFGTMDRNTVLLEKGISIAIKLVSR